VLELSRLRGRTTAEQSERWGEVTRAFARVQAMGDGPDPVARIAVHLGVIGGRLDARRPEAVAAPLANGPAPTAVAAAGTPGNGGAAVPDASCTAPTGRS